MPLTHITQKDNISISKKIDEEIKKKKIKFTREEVVRDDLYD